MSGHRCFLKILRGRAIPVLTAAALVGWIKVTSACSVFALRTESGSIVGRNLDWTDPLPGLVCVNTRGAEKTILPWKGDWPIPSDTPAVTWVSRLGSAAFTAYGRDFIAGGMNERGLIVEEASLNCTYAPDDGRPGISCAQWMQYQLDCFATVEAVIAHLSDLRHDGEGWHYLIADSTGNAAVIEFADGVAIAYTGAEIPYPAITNAAYSEALATLPLDTAFGGHADIASGNDSYGRFVRLAASMDAFMPSDSPAEDAFEILDNVRVEDTQRSIVYDNAARRILWRTVEHRQARIIELATLDFSADAPTRVLDIEQTCLGDVAHLLDDYSVETNRRVVQGVRGHDEPPRHTLEVLELRGITLDQALESIARHPATTSGAGSVTTLSLDSEGSTPETPSPTASP